LSNFLPTADVPEATDAAEYKEGEGEEEVEEVEEKDDDKPMTGSIPEPTTT
jgi:hypothetical protein